MIIFHSPLNTVRDATWTHIMCSFFHLCDMLWLLECSTSDIVWLLTQASGDCGVCVLGLLAESLPQNCPTKASTGCRNRNNCFKPFNFGWFVLQQLMMDIPSAINTYYFLSLLFFRLFLACSFHFLSWSQPVCSVFLGFYKCLLVIFSTIYWLFIYFCYWG